MNGKGGRKLVKIAIKTDAVYARKQSRDFFHPIRSLPSAPTSNSPHHYPSSLQTSSLRPSPQRAFKPRLGCSSNPPGWKSTNFNSHLNYDFRLSLSLLCLIPKSQNLSQPQVLSLLSAHKLGQLQLASNHDSASSQSLKTSRSLKFSALSLLTSSASFNSHPNHDFHPLAFGQSQSVTLAEFRCKKCHRNFTTSRGLKAHISSVKRSGCYLAYFEANNEAAKNRSASPPPSASAQPTKRTNEDLHTDHGFSVQDHYSPGPSPKRTRFRTTVEEEEEEEEDDEDDLVIEEYPKKVATPLARGVLVKD
ncbi:hypothetical protein FRC03_012802 [Tulasnella sp. 419]|nr:hypothetical protein FRC03_012802 [Tulasnella sp. 419]